MTNGVSLTSSDTELQIGWERGANSSRNFNLLSKALNVLALEAQRKQSGDLNPYVWKSSDLQMQYDPRSWKALYQEVTSSDDAIDLYSEDTPSVSGSGCQLSRKISWLYSNSPEKFWYNNIDNERFCTPFQFNTLCHIYSTPCNMRYRGVAK
jgi:hypothetical protein